MYKIKLNNLRFRGHIGVMPEEKRLGQALELDLIIEMAQDFSGGDEIGETLSYADVYDRVAHVVQDSRVDLLERLALDILEAVKAVAPEKVATVEVHLRKLALPLEGILDSAEVELKG